jgi:hypothetical protein
MVLRPTAHVLPELAMPQIRCTWASLLWVSAMANHLPPGLAGRTLPSCQPGILPRLTAKLAAKPP